MDGIIQGSFGINATITLCPKLASELPGLQAKLTEIAAAQGQQKEQIRELKRLITNLNSVSRNIGEQRQIELLKNFSKQMSEQQAAGQKQTQEHIADLADKLDDLKTLLIEKLGNADTRDKTTTAINGPVGDAIASFDLTKAHDLLEDIRAQLNVIGGKVDESLKQEKDIKGDTAATRSIVEQYQAKEKENEKAYADMMAAKINDPHSLGHVRFMALKLPGRSRWTIQGSIMPAIKVTDTKVQIALSEGQKSWLLNALWDGNIGWKVDTEEIGDRAVICLSALDARTGNRRQWTQSYTVQLDQSSFPRANFIPTGDPTLGPETGAPCSAAAGAH